MPHHRSDALEDAEHYKEAASRKHSLIQHTSTAGLYDASSIHIYSG